MNMKAPVRISLAFLALQVVPALTMWAQDAAPPTPAKTASAGGPTTGDELALDQGQVADKYKRLEELMMKMAELEGAGNPKRAALLTRAVEQSKERLTKTQLESVVKL